MFDPATLAAKVFTTLATTYAKKKFERCLSNREQSNALQKALECALDSLRETGYESKGFGVLDESFLISKPVVDELWGKLLDPSTDEEIDYLHLAKELEEIYVDYEVGPDGLDAIEFLIDTLIDEMWQHGVLRSILTAKIVRQHDQRLSRRKVKVLINCYLKRKSTEVSKIQQKELGTGHSYVEPLIEKEIVDLSPSLKDGKSANRYKPIDIYQLILTFAEHRMGIVADSGYGKSTVLRALFLRLADTYNKHSLLPIYWLPKEAESCTRENLRTLVTQDLMVAGFRESQVKTFVEEQFYRRKMIFIIDALDQMQSDNKLIGCLEGNSFAENMVIVSSRQGVWDQNKGHFTKFTRFAIRPFDDCRWEEYMGTEKLALVKGVVDQNFLKIPLLLRLVCDHWLTGESKPELLKSRASLYKEMFTHLLEHRQEDKDATNAALRASLPKLSDVRAWLRRLAHDTLALGKKNHFSRELAQNILGYDKLDKLENFAAFLDIFEPSGEIAFRHRSFQEFLAAECIKAYLENHDNDFSNFQTYLYHPDWEEPIIFLAGLLEDWSAEMLVNMILNPPKGSALTLYREHIRLACLCLNEMGSAGQKYREIVVGLLREDLQNPVLIVRTISNLPQFRDNRVTVLLHSILSHESAAIRVKVVRALGEIDSPDAVISLIESLGDEDHRVRTAAVRSLSKIKSQVAVLAIIETLKDKNEYVRRSAARALREINSPKAVKPLVAMLKNENKWVQGVVANLLGDIESLELAKDYNDTATDDRQLEPIAATRTMNEVKPPEVVSPCASIVEDKDEDARITAVNALSGIKSAESERFLLTTVENDTINVRIAAIYALGGIKSLKAVIPLVTMLCDDSKEVRVAAAYALGAIGSPDTVKSLVEAVKDINEEVRAAALYALGEIRDSAAVEPLLEMLKDDRLDVRKGAEGTLREIASRVAIAPFLEAAKDENIFVRRVAINALGEIESTEAMAALVEGLVDENEWVRRAAAHALHKLHLPELVAMPFFTASEANEFVRGAAKRSWHVMSSLDALEPFIDAAKDENAFVRQVAVCALGEIKSPEAIGVLVDALKDDNSWVRRAATNGLAVLRSPVAVAPLIEAAKDEDEIVRRTVARALGEIKSPDSMKSLIEMLKDKNQDVRSTARRALREFSSYEAVKPLAKAILDTNTYVRLTAIDALSEIPNKEALKELIHALDKSKTEDLVYLLAAIERCDTSIRSFEQVKMVTY